MKKLIFSTTVVFVLMLWAGVSVHAGVISPSLQNLLETAAADDPVPVIVRLSDPMIDLKNYKDPDKALRRSKLIKALKGKAEKGQASLKKFLKTNGIKTQDVELLWMINAIAVTVPATLVEPLADRSDVESVDLDAEIVAPAGSASGSSIPEWNIDQIRAPELWALGHDGTGVVVATMDSGVDYYHPDIGPKWRGGANSWFDPNGQHASPYDKTGHGTQVMGLIVGGDAGGTAIGVAPGAQWIAVKIYDDNGRSRLSRIHLGFQWLLDPDGNPDVDDAPDIVNNSWYLQNTVDQCNTEFVFDIAALKAAGVAVVFSAGNTGPDTASSVSPSNNPGSVAVGATDQFLNVAGFSARGPSACGGTYPAVVAPGANVRTADRTFGGIFPDSYLSVSGTSFAAPHVSGAMALLLGINPALTVSELESALTLSAQDLGTGGPDNASGFGLIDVMEAYLVLAGEPAAPVAADDAYAATENTLLMVSGPGVLDNDSDANGDPLTAALMSSAANGSALLNSDGSFQYSPAPGFTGTDSFTYKANDGALDSNPATVTLTVNPLPVNAPPVANNDTASTVADTAVTIDVLANDSDADGDGLTISAVAQGTHGSVANYGTDLTYTPNAGFSGTDSFTYRANDGALDSNLATVTVTVTPPPTNSPPVAVDDSATVKRYTKNPTSVTINVVANDYDPNGSIDPTTLTIVSAPTNGGTAVSNGDGTISFQPKKRFRGTDVFSYTVLDNEGAVSNAATVTVEVSR